MAFDENLARRVQEILLPLTGFSEKRMFGGAGYMHNGNMICGIYKDNLILRLEPEDAESLVQQEHVRVFDITGRPMKGWVMIGPDGCQEDQQLVSRIKLAVKFVATLPAK